MVTAQASTTGRNITRNSSRFKKVPYCEGSAVPNREEEEDEDIQLPSDTSVALDGAPSPQNSTPMDRPKRMRRKPEYLKDYVV